jgi:hypothetical protein
MGKVLGRVVAADNATPRGPDASHRIRVPRGWLTEGANVELELPRHLTCAGCEGGGCDACDRSGAITVRGRADPPDLVAITLPAGDRDGVFVIRIPEHGGLAAAGSELPRGHLLLRVEPSGHADPSVRLSRSPAALLRAQSGVRPARRADSGLERRPLHMVGVALVLGVALVIWALLSRP